MAKWNLVLNPEAVAEIKKRYMNMNRMKIIIYLMTLLCNNLFGQQEYPVAIGGASGIFIDITNSPGSYIIERSETSSENWIEVGKTNNPLSEVEFNERLTALNSQFSDFVFPVEKQITQIWNIWQRTNRVDSIPYWGNIPFVKTALGTMCFDATAKLNTEYQYRISNVENVQQKEFTNSVYYPRVFKNDNISFYSSSAEVNKIFLDFRTFGGNNPSAFRVFRRDNGSGSYQKINAVNGFNITNDTLSLVLIDTSVTAYNFYNYFIQPLDLFGNEGTPSDTIFVGAYNFQNVPLPHNVQIVSDDSSDAFRLSWSLPNPEAVVSVRIFRSEIFDSGFVQIAEISPQINNYVDFMTEPMKRYYYYFRLTGPLGEVSPATARFGGFHQSNIDPIPPANIKAESLSNGVKLQWENSEDYIEGFWVYRSNGFGDSLALISNLIKEEKPFTVFTDTSEELSGKLTYLYSIRSSSTSHVLSSFSDTISIRPEIETVPPAPTGVIAFLQDDNSVRIIWDDMTEIESTVGYYLIFRRTIDPFGKMTSEYELLIDSFLSISSNVFIDKTTEAGKTYEYAVQSIDLFGGQSELSNPVQLYLPLVEVKSPGGVYVTRDKDGVIIKWDPVIEDDVTEYRIYRQQRNEEKDFLGSVKKGNSLQLTDRGVKKGELYFYSVTAVDENQQESSSSYTISIRP